MSFTRRHSNWRLRGSGEISLGGRMRSSTFPGVLICRLSAAMAALLAGGTASAQLTTWSYGTAELQYVIDDGGSPAWQDYDPAPTVSATPLFDGIKIFGTGPDDRVFEITGADYISSPFDDPDYRGNQLVISGTATFDGANWRHPFDTLPTHFSIGFGFSGGTLDIYKTDTSFWLLDSDDNFVIGVGSGFFGGLGEYEPGGYGVGWEFVDAFGCCYQTAVKMQWNVKFGFDWTGMAPEDTFSFSIPHDSIDIKVRVCQPCDVNCDGSVNQFDIQSFVSLLSGGGSACSLCAADANEDGSVNQFDIQSFVECLGG